MTTDPIFWMYVAVLGTGTVAGLAALPWNLASMRQVEGALQTLQGLCLRERVLAR